jgi:hypothetical protein
MSLYADAAAGTLDRSSLQYYLNTSNHIDAPSTQPDETSGLTALALAAWEGHADVVQLLLDHGAAADALSSEHRTPLWIVTARGKGRERAKIVDMLLKKNANPKYSHPQLRNGSTPLENELRQLRDVGVIKLLVNANGLTSTAQELGKKIKNAKIIDAMMTSEDRKQIRAALVDVVMGLVLFIVAWANVIGAMANALLERFSFKGKKDGEVADNISKEVAVPRTKQEFKANINDFVRKHRLDAFFPTSGGGKLLETLVAKALELQKDKASPLGRVAKTDDIVKLALYQPIIYCDDSGSMRDPPSGAETNVTRMDVQATLVERIASICTRLVPDDLGVHLRFINTKLSATAENLRMDGIRAQMSRVQAGGSTEIGTNLRQQILDPFVYNPPGGKMARPLFVSIITDGIPGGPRGISPERTDTLKQEILACHKYLRRKGLSDRCKPAVFSSAFNPCSPPVTCFFTAVIFQLSQIGSDSHSEEFLKGLREDSNLTGLLYVTAQKLDSQYAQFRHNEDGLEAWLVETLLAPILDANSD